MIKKLFVQNLAIIDEVEINFTPGFNVITGETGAGKSILVGALSLILGNRADLSSLRKEDKKCVIEAEFSVDNQNITHFLKENDLDNEEALIIRREIAPSGKSRSFINDTPVSVGQLKTIGGFLVDLHQQFDTLQIGDSAFQRNIIDLVAGNESLLSTYHQQYKTWKELQRQLAELQEAQANFNKEADYLQFQFEELEQANFSENEIENLDAEQVILSNATDIKEALSAVSYTLKNNETPIASLLKQLANKLSNYQEMDTNIAALVARLYSAQIEISDLADEADTIGDKTAFDAERLEFVNERISLGYRLLKKHNVQTTNELREIHFALSQKLMQINHSSEQEEKLEASIKKQKQTLLETAKQISNTRKSVIPKVETEIQQLLSQVGMPNARIQVQMMPSQELLAYGAEDVEIFFDANKSGHFEPIRKVASGGELSRLMLCIKSLMAQNEKLPTLIFDEIDTGISGAAAVQVGNIMKTLSQNLQIISITHLPQIAGKANQHLFVYKEMKSDGTINTAIRKLDKEGRINAIAQMIGGEKPSPAAIANATELLEEA